jgi:hypothetical protein
MKPTVLQIMTAVTDARQSHVVLRRQIVSCAQWG